MISYRIGNSDQFLSLTGDVLDHFKLHQQKRGKQSEAGGQLFGKLSKECIVIEKATGPRNEDIRSRSTYRPHRQREQEEIDYWHSKNLHYVGDWHTHPEKCPQPSSIDLTSIKECFVKSQHSLHFFLLIIVGQKEFPDGLHLSIHDDKRWFKLHPEPPR